MEDFLLNESNSDLLVFIIFGTRLLTTIHFDTLQFLSIHFSSILFGTILIVSIRFTSRQIMRSGIRGIFIPAPATKQLRSKNGKKISN